MTGTAYFFVMCPPFEIVSKKTQLIVADRGYFEISNNRIRYKITNRTTDFLMLSPREGIGIMTELPPYIDIDSFQLLQKICEGVTEICFSPAGKTKETLFLDFMFGDILPFTMKQHNSGFYQLRALPSSIYQEFYRMSMSVEDTLTTTISTFDENVFIPFKQKFISTIHNRSEDNPSKTVSTFSRDFPKFFKLHQDLLTILHTQAKQVSDHQHLSFSIFSPILRKIRMHSILREYFEIKSRRKRIELKIDPVKLDSDQIIEKIAPLVGIQ